VTVWQVPVVLEQVLEHRGRVQLKCFAAFATCVLREDLQRCRAKQAGYGLRNTDCSKMMRAARDEVSPHHLQHVTAMPPHGYRRAACERFVLCPEYAELAHSQRNCLNPFVTAVRGVERVVESERARAQAWRAPNGPRVARLSPLPARLVHSRYRQAA
jgi:hypothetical protein